MIKDFRYVSCAMGLVMLLALQGCGVDFSSQYAIAKLDLPDGKAIYFELEVRGINGNYDVIAISQNGDPCVSYNPDTDYCICSGPQYVYYKLEGDTLHLYHWTVNHATARQAFPVKIINHTYPMDTGGVQQKYAEMGITRLELPVDHTKTCG